MATRFTRVTVVGDERQVDVSLPAQQPVLTLVPQLCSLLSLRAERPGSPWTVATIAGGILDPRRTLDDAGITDADVLYLAPPAEAPEPPFVEDVVDEVGAQLDNASRLSEGVEWKGTSRVVGCAALGAAVLAGLAWLLALPALDRASAAAALVAVGLLAAALGRPLRDRGAAWLAGAGALAWTLAGWTLGGLALGDRAVGEQGVAFTEVAAFRGWTTAAGAGIGLVTFWLAGRRWHSLGAAGLALAPPALLAALLDVVLPADRVAAVMVVVALVVAGVAPQLAVANAGLVPLLRTAERGTRVTRSTLVDVVRRGQVVLTGVVPGNALVAAIAVAVLLASGGVAGPALGAVSGLVFALRSRAFTRSAQVLPMLAVLAAAATTTAVTLPAKVQLSGRAAVWTTGIGLLLVGVAIVGLGVGQLGDVAAARLRRVFDVLEVVAVIAVLPLVLAVFHTYGWVRHFVS